MFLFPISKEEKAYWLLIALKVKYLKNWPINKKANITSVCRKCQALLRDIYANYYSTVNNKGGVSKN